VQLPFPVPKNIIIGFFKLDSSNSSLFRFAYLFLLFLSFSREIIFIAIFLIALCPFTYLSNFTFNNLLSLLFCHILAQCFLITFTYSINSIVLLVLYVVFDNSAVILSISYSFRNDSTFLVFFVICAKSLYSPL